MEKKLIILIAIVVLGFLGLKAVGAIYTTYFLTIGEAIPVSEFFSGILVTVLLLIFVGLGLGFIAYRICRNWSDDDTKIAGGGIVGTIFVANLCVGGACIPAAVIGSIYGLLALIPMGIGSLIARSFRRG